MSMWTVFKGGTEQNLETSTRYRVLFLAIYSFMSKTLEPDGDGNEALAQPAFALTSLDMTNSSYYQKTRSPRNIVRDRKKHAGN
jgi:hypothetical protein